MTFSNNISSDTLDHEFDFGDRRLNKRGTLIVESIGNNMGQSIPNLCASKAELYGAYRFFDSDLVTPEKILASHKKATIQRIKNEKIALILQDSTDLTFDYLEGLSGLGPLHPHVEKGMRLHPSFAVTEQGTALGIVDCIQYTRDRNAQKKHRNSLSIEEKESFRWLAGYQTACSIALSCPHTVIVSIADQEGDIYECLAAAEEANLGSRAHILIRAQHNRSLAESDESTNKLLKKLIRCPPAYEAKLKLKREKARDLNIAVRACAVELKAPNTCKKKSLPSINMNAVLVSEIEPTSDEPVEWLLLTTLPINTAEEIEKIIAYYATRWQIEVFFKVLKSGCKIESIRLQTVARIENYIALSLIVAWRTMLTTYLPREYPNVCCTVLFTDIEWKLSYRTFYKGKRPLPDKPPILREVCDLVAALGGYLKRKDPPGIQTIWKGIVRLTAMVEGYEMAKTEAALAIQ